MLVALDHAVDFLPSPVFWVEPIAVLASVAFYYDLNLVQAWVAAVDVAPIAVLASAAFYYD